MHPFQLWFSTNYAHFGWAGSLTILLGCLITSIPYRDRDFARYSILNHFISELGEIGVSKWAAVFNTGMIIGGALYIPFLIGLGLKLHSVWSYLGLAAGMLAAVSALLVGVFSMDRIEPHTKAAMTYFRSGLITILLFSVAVFFQPQDQRVIPLAVNFFGLLSVLAYTAFLLMVDTKKHEEDDEDKTLDPSEKKERPRFWRTPFIEWLVFFSTMIWFLCVSLILLF